MRKHPLPGPTGFSNLLKEVKARIQTAQTQAILAANAELVRLYWDIGRLIEKRQRNEAWGAAVIPRLARALRNELPEVKGFSERNLDRMIAFSRTYPDPADFSPPAVAKLPLAEKMPPAVAKLRGKASTPQTTTSMPGSLLWRVP